MKFKTIPIISFGGPLNKIIARKLEEFFDENDIIKIENSYGKK